jgi:predicted ATPase
MAKQKKRIILTGAQGTGKTTLMNALASDGTRTISHIRKFAAEKNIDISTASEAGQKEFFKSLKKELSSKKSYVSDRGLTCVAAYTFEKAVTEEISKKTADKQYMDIVKFHTENPDILLVYVPIEFEIEDDGVRTANKEHQATIDFLIKNILETSGINYITVTGTVEERVSQIEAALKSKEEQ